MREEQVTRSILKWLIANGWEIVCYDFPQSGTGRMLHPNNREERKNKDGIIPDIVAVKNGICLFMENKNRFYYPDYLKQNALKTSNDHSDSISELLKNYTVDAIYYGIGLPDEAHGQRSMNAAHLVDFILCVREDTDVQIGFDPASIFFRSRSCSCCPARPCRPARSC